jgi:hypothetical protein
LSDCQFSPKISLTMALTLQRICKLLAALTVLGAQVFGLHHGFICEHGDHPAATPVAHCESHSGHPDEGEPNDSHPPWIVPLQALPSAVDVELGPHAAWGQPVRTPVHPRPVCLRVPAAIRPEPANDPPGSLSVLVAQKIVILV